MKNQNTQNTQPTKKHQVLLAVLAFVLVVGLFASLGFALNYQEKNNNEKEIYLQILSPRDDFASTEQITTECATLGELLRSLDYCAYEESTYGLYVKGFHGMQDDMTNQYWWCILVDGQSSVKGADEIVLEDGVCYTLELKNGW